MIHTNFSERSKQGAVFLQMHSGAAAGAVGPAPELVVCGSRLVGAAPEGKESGKSSKSRSDKKKVSKKVIDPPFQYERNNPAIKVPAFSLLLARQKSSIRLARACTTGY